MAGSGIRGIYREIISDRGNLLLLVGIVAGIGRAWQKAIAGRPEWSYWQQLATQSWQDTAGADKEIFGYLPGFALMVKPFFLLEPLGLVVFLVLNAMCGIGIIIVLRRHFQPDGESAHPALLLMTAIALFLGLQNNQVVIPSMYLTLVAYFSIVNHSKRGAVALALAILIKTLPATLFLLLTLIGRLRLAIVAALVLGILSFSLAGISDGWRSSLDAHLGFVEQVSAQNPNRALTETQAPRSLADNTSLSAAVVRLAPDLGNTLPRILNLGIFLGSLALACYLSFVSSRRLDNAPMVLALWLSWTIMAAPFGRYYYLVFLLPAWWLLWPKAPAGGYSSSALLGALWFIALLPLASRSGPVFLVLVVGTFVVCAWHVYRGLREAVPRKISP